MTRKSDDFKNLTFFDPTTFRAMAEQSSPDVVADDSTVVYDTTKGDGQWDGPDDKSVRGGLFVVDANGNVRRPDVLGVIIFIPIGKHDPAWVMYEPLPLSDAQRERIRLIWEGWRPWAEPRSE